MMEEVSDDTNGESTFEFVGGKNDENMLKEAGLKDDNNSVPVAEGLLSSFSSASSNMSNLPTFRPIEIPVESTSTPVKTEVPMYSPSQYPSPPSSIFQPPLPPATPADYSHNQYSQSQYSQQSLQQPVHAPQTEQPSPLLPPPQQSFAQIPIPDCAVPPTFGSVPMESHGSTEGGVWGWIKGSNLLNKVAEKAKSSVDSVITTLDPGMKEIINSGGDIDVVVASSNEAKVSAVREAFQQVFGKATVQGLSAQSCSIAPQPVGYSAGLKAAEERIGNLRQNGFVQQDQIVLAIENFITELTPENWFDIGCLLLQDFNSGLSLQVYTEAIPISSHFVQQAKDQTPADYPLGWSGYSVTMGQVIGSAVGVHHSEWHQALTGVSRREILLLAAKTIAGLYRAQMRR